MRLYLHIGAKYYLAPPAVTLFCVPVLVLRHEQCENLGNFAEILDRTNYPYLYHDLAGPPVSLDSHAGLIVMGGPMSANDPLPGLVYELDVIRAALAKQIPVLGICLGAQLIAKALGARVFDNASSEIGWAPVSFADAAREDRLFHGIPSPTTFFHWHSQTFDLPAGAVLLASSEKCRHQAYRYRENVYGIQFHPEITAPMIEDWCLQPFNCGDVAGLPAPIDPHAADPSPLSQLIFTRWLTFLSS